MKKLLMLAFFYLVTWNDQMISGVRLCGEAGDFNQHRVFTTRSRAKEFAKILEDGGNDWCIKIYKVEGIK